MFDILFPFTIIYPKKWKRSSSNKIKILMSTVWKITMIVIYILYLLNLTTQFTLIKIIHISISILPFSIYLLNLDLELLMIWRAVLTQLLAISVVLTASVFCISIQFSFLDEDFHICHSPKNEQYRDSSILEQSLCLELGGEWIK